MDERSSSRASGTTYHSFNDVELFEPASPRRPPVTYDSASLQHLEHLQQELQRQQREAAQREAARERERESRPATGSAKMQRQDSGYESTTPPRRASTSASRPSVGRWPSTSSSAGREATGAVTRQRTRPSFRRAAQSLQYQQSARSSNQSLHLVRSTAAPSKPAAGFFHFPSPDQQPAGETIPLADSAPDARVAPTPAPTPPPQTTHYWTSDRTRRLEYAAIDAATMGVKGWVMRHLVPECFVPRELRHVSFDDDSGSVRRYRLELEEDNHDEKVARQKGFRRSRGWRFWRRRKEASGPVVII